MACIIFVRLLFFNNSLKFVKLQQPWLSQFHLDNYTLASFWRYKAKIEILFFCEPSLWVEVFNDVLVPGFNCANRASRGCNQQIFMRGDKWHPGEPRKPFFYLNSFDPLFSMGERWNVSCRRSSFIISWLWEECNCIFDPLFAGLPVQWDLCHHHSHSCLCAQGDLQGTNLSPTWKLYSGQPWQSLIQLHGVNWDEVQGSWNGCGKYGKAGLALKLLRMLMMIVFRYFVCWQFFFSL